MSAEQLNQTVQIDYDLCVAQDKIDFCVSHDNPAVFKFRDQPNTGTVTLPARFAVSGVSKSQIGILFKGKNAKDRFFTYTCPCGVEVSYPLNGIPEATTPHPCGVEGHYSVMFED
jgi:hypothetical protein